MVILTQTYARFESSAENAKSLLGIMLKELKVYMNDKADEVYIAMRRDYNSVLGGGEVPRPGELLPKTQRLARKEMIRIIDGVEKVFSRIAGLDFKDEDDEAEKSSDDEGGVLGVGKKEVDEDLKVKREASQETSPDESTANGDSDSESESKVKSAGDHERLNDSVGAKVESGDSDDSKSD